MLTERQLFILQILIDDYIRTAEAVGSRTISKRKEVTFSSATIRNELADLEDMGYIEKTHSSSGRVPSEKGYRFYVDNLLSPPVLSNNDVKDIHSLFAEKMVEVEKVIQQSAKILSELTQYTSIILGPEVFETKLRQVQIIPLSKETAVVILVADSGHVENQTITIPPSVSMSDIEKVVNIMNERLKDIPLVSLKSTMMQEMATVLKKHIENYNQVNTMLDNLFLYTNAEKVYYGGKTNILAQPEFKDVEKVRLLLNTFEQDDLMYNILRPEKKGIEVRIGQENDLEAMQECSIITADYFIEGKRMGSLALLGPTRMEYHRSMSLLGFLANDLTSTLTERYRSFKHW
ncbi:heat-inducible transcriptional repressor HrcA [Guptibacillus algicola]|uniref:heat-inducible transcriptional repressor HrcA n=1 Tax=Guptibacillus algicola TaxID=225844 RepID=UPI001CD7EA0F|nr:heat-inducible transcriptional repressor HrcA [Alkalihalobacillus algicola]MCA0986103.1 heat-inducible transcriptional repressor HrcA [Alkalihalobacillus algicola]